MAHKSVHSSNPMKEHWQTSRSKKIPGKIYFYNPDTGESVWNLGDIDPARRKYIYISSNLSDKSYPEPLNGPRQLNQSQSYTPEKINTQVNNLLQLQHNVQTSHHSKWKVPPPPSFEQESVIKGINTNNTIFANNFDHIVTKHGINNSNAPIILSNDTVSIEMVKKYFAENQQLNNTSAKNIQLYDTNQSINQIARFPVITTNDTPKIETTDITQTETSQKTTPIKYLNGINFKKDYVEVKPLSERFKAVQETNSFKRVITAIKMRKIEKACITKKAKKFKMPKQVEKEKVATPTKKRKLSCSQLQPVEDVVQKEEKLELDPNDLRFKLAARRKSYTMQVNSETVKEEQQVSEPTVSDEDTKSEQVTSNTKKKKKKRAKRTIAETDSNCDEGNILSKPEVSIRRKLNLSFLKNLAIATARVDRWYICVDTNILLSNLRFVDILIKSDPTCRMLVPYQVHRELENIHLGRRKCHLSARIATHYLARELKLKKAVVGQSAVKSSDLKINCLNGDDLIINCCLQAIEENYHVVLLTNDITLNSKAESSEIVSFTLQQLKDCIYNKDNYSDKKEEFKIVIPNIIDMSKWSFEGHVANNLLGNTTNNTVVYAQNKYETPKTVCFTNQPNPMILPSIEQPALTVPNKPKDFGPLANTVLENSNIHFNSTQNQNRSDVPVFKIPKMVDHKSVNTYVPNKTNEIDNYPMVTRTVNDENLYKTQKERIWSLNQFKNNKDSSPIKQNVAETVGSWSLETESDGTTFNESIASGQVPKYLFDIRNENCDERIGNRSEEWVSCFEQIMEEVLTQILQLYPIKLGMIPAPWNFREATYNIRLLFDYNQRLSTLSNSLYYSICLNSDHSGNITRNMCPNQFMTMFNEGTELVKAIKNIYPNNSDVEDAEQRLLNLISEIRDIADRKFDNNLDIEFNDKGFLNEEREVSEASDDNSSTYSGSNQTVMCCGKDGDRYSKEGGSDKSVILNALARENNFSNIEHFMTTLFHQIKTTFKTIQHFNAKCNSLRNDDATKTPKYRSQPQVAKIYQMVYGISNLLERIMQRETGPEVVASVLSYKKNFVSTNYRNIISQSIRLFKLLLDDLDVTRTALNTN